ncbi:hypothetical protein CTEN210_01187 [Chaetoceros tenuissimus]|uniref:Leucine-rich repeat domain-containing protein n=1 Tax=Chaetoceros tenuissimus TaxID=426638 RepID=A0AAD3CFJ9_9STRA|nr:hypothetical protein CTEN210_01187 [Chaetoceros tenuissimus]
MRVQTEEWRRFIPGVRMYKGKKTLFYNGEILVDAENGEWLIYDKEERQKWEVIIVLPGVEVIPQYTFGSCINVEAVIMSDAVRRVELRTFINCKSLKFVKVSRNLEYIGEAAFFHCLSLHSIFIPSSCREIYEYAFSSCDKLFVFRVPQHTTLGEGIISCTALSQASPFATYDDGDYDNDEEVNEWIKNHHADNEFSLHRACSSFNPLDEIVFDIVKREGLKAFKKTDRNGVTASEYLYQNPFAEIKEQTIINRYILDMMGEVI